MPVNPDHAYTDTSHPSVIDNGRPYGCWNHREDRLQQPVLAPSGWTPDGRQVVVAVRTNWLPIQCGHASTHGGLSKHNDPKCTGCRWVAE